MILISIEKAQSKIYSSPMAKNLFELGVGNTGEIKNISGDSILVGRLFELGFKSGATVKVVHKSIFGDPIIVDVEFSRVALRKAEAVCVEL